MTRISQVDMLALTDRLRAEVYSAAEEKFGKVETVDKLAWACSGFAVSNVLDALTAEDLRVLLAEKEAGWRSLANGKPGEWRDD